MRVESNHKPNPIEIRKLGVIDGEAVVYLYLNSDIKQEAEPDLDGEPRTMYMYESVHYTTPVPVELLPMIDTALIADHGYNQTTAKQRTVEHLDRIKTQLKESTVNDTLKVDRRDKLSKPKQVDLDNIKNLVLATKKTTPTTS